MVQDGKLRPGTVIDDRFELAQRLGSGATGVVWRVVDHESGTDAALKTLHAKMSHDEMAIAQLGREADVLRQLDHPNIARSFAFQPNGPIVYLAMELVDGVPLHLLIGRHTRDKKYFTHREVLDMFDQLCSAVGYAHSKYIVHRDLKPHNVMVTGEGPDQHVKVLDFGIARLLEGSIFDATTLGRQLGSLFYMSPEQTRGEPADARSDVFALATILFELLTLHRTWAWDMDDRPIPAFERPVPHGEANAIASVFTRLTSADRPIASQCRLEIPPLLDNIIRRALAIDPDQRYATVSDFSREALSALKKITGSVEAPTELAHAVAYPELTIRASGDSAQTTVLGPADDSTAGSTVVDREISNIDAVRQAHAAKKKEDPASQVTQVPKPERPIPQTLEYRSVGDSLEPPGPTLRTEAPVRVTPLEALNRTPPATGEPMAPLNPPRRAARDAMDTLPPVRVERSDTGEVPRVSPQAVTTPTPSAPPMGIGIGQIMGIVLAAFAAAIVVGTLVFRPEVEVATKIVPNDVDTPPNDTHRFPELWAQLAKVKANPASDEARDEMLTKITSAATTIADQKEAESIVGCANGNAMMMNVQGLENCLRRLESASH